MCKKIKSERSREEIERECVCKKMKSERRREESKREGNKERKSQKECVRVR